jgi:NADH-quinone oxidoreductase subunit L
LHESPAVITLPLIMLAIPSVVAGFAIGPMLFGDYFAGAITVLPEHNVLGQVGEHYTGPIGFFLHGVLGLPCLLAFAGVGTAWLLYMKRPDYADRIKSRFRGVYNFMLTT